MKDQSECRVSDSRAQLMMSDNAILRSLPTEAQARIVEYSTIVRLAQHRVVYRRGDPIENIYFLESGAVSLLSIGTDGRAIETGVVCREGLVGGTVALGSSAANSQAIVQIHGMGLRVPTSRFLQAYEELPVLARLVNRHLDFLLFQAQQNALCHALHSIESRFCRCVLQASDTLDSDVLDLTQEFRSHILGVQRTSVSMVAHALQVAGGIRTRRGKIEILDRSELQKTACECYGAVKQHIEAAYAKAA